MKRTSISLLILFVFILLLNILFLTPGKAHASTQMGIGNYVQFGTYNNQPILWRVINIDEEGNPLLFSEQVLSFKAFDSFGNVHQDQLRKITGSNYWQDSNIRQWLNSAEKKINWIQNEPSAINLIEGTTGYNDEKGFLADGNFTEYERNAIKDVKHKSILSSVDISNKDGGSLQWNGGPNYGILENGIGNYDSAYYELVTDRVFLLSLKELKEYVYDRGYSILMKDAPIAEAESYNWNMPPYYWLRTPAISFDYIYGNMLDMDTLITVSKTKMSILDEYNVYHLSDLFRDNSARAYGGVRPALYLDDDLIDIEMGTGTVGTPYVLERQLRPSSWAQNSIELALKTGIISNNTFIDYRKEISREEFCGLVLNLYEILSTEEAIFPTVNKFIDTENSDVLKANELGIVNGVSHNRFSPDSSITREQIAVMLNNLLVSLEISPNTISGYVYFEDEDEISTWAKSSVQILNKIGIISGVGNDRINPKGHVTNEQAIVMLTRLLEGYEDKDF